MKYTGRPQRHVVRVYARQTDFVMIITVYQPDPERWIEFKKKVMKCGVCKSEEGKGGEDMRLLRV